MENVIVVNGVEYERKQKGDAIRIVVLHRGWVVVGRVRQDGDTVVIDDASVVRVWGTTKGLGEIAAGGPTAKTVLDPCGTVRVHQLAIVAQFDCMGEKWTLKAR